MLTKIIATITEYYDEKKLIDINKAGANIVRINFTHSTPKTAGPIIKLINKLNKLGKTNLSILLDTKGPDIRTGVRENKLIVKKNQILKIFIDKNKVDPEFDLFCDYPNILSDVKKGQEIIIDSGLLLVIVKEIKNNHLIVKAMNDAEIGSKRHINLPGVKISLPSLIEKDKVDIIFGIKAGISYLAASFIRSSENVDEIRKFLKANKGEDIKIISKIENQEAIENLEGIVRNSDGIMIARGDLGIELPIHQLPTFQKKILDMCFKYGKPVIVATELLKSMVYNPFPTRAEISDVYNSVIMRADALMLSDETTIGKYPIKTIEFMKKTIKEAEKTINNKHKDFEILDMNESNFLKKAIAKHSLILADEINAKAIVIFSYSGNLSRYISSYRPNIDVYSITTSEKVHRSLDLNYGIISEKIKKRGKNNIENQEIAMKILKSKGVIKKGDFIVTVGVNSFNGIHQRQSKIISVI